MSTLNFDIEAEFDLEELEKAKKRMGEIEDVFLKLVKLSKTDFTKSFEKFSKISSEIRNGLSSIPGLVWTLTILAAELFSRASAYLLDWFQYNKILKEDMSAIFKGAENEKEILDALQLAIQGGIEGARELYDVMFEISKQPKLPEMKNIGGFTYFKDSAYQLKGWVEAAKEVMNTEYAPLLNLILSLYKDQEYWANLTTLGSKTVAEGLKKISTTGYGKNVINFADATSELARNTKELDTAQQYGLLTQDMASQKAMELVNDFNLLKQAGLDENLILNQMKDRIQDLSLWFDAFGKTAPAAFDALKQKSEAALPSFRQFLAEGKVGDMAAYDTSKQNGAFPAPSAELDKYEIDYPEKAPEPVKQGFFGGLKQSFTSGLSDMLGSFGIGKGEGILGNLFGGKGTGGGLFGMLGSFAGPQEGILGTIQQFASMIPGIGGMISNIIGGIGTAFNALKSLFGGLSEEEKVAKDVTRDLGVSISDDLAKKIADSSKEIGDRFTAVIVGPVVQRCFAEAAV
jgi:hypothetical protein